MYTAISILIVIASILLTIIVLIQNSKGGGLAANFAAGNQTLGLDKQQTFWKRQPGPSPSQLLFFAFWQLHLSPQTGERVHRRCSRKLKTLLRYRDNHNSLLQISRKHLQRRLLRKIKLKFFYQDISSLPL